VPGPAILLRFAAALGLALGLTLVAPGLDAAAAISYTVNATGDAADASPATGTAAHGGSLHDSRGGDGEQRDQRSRRRHRPGGRLRPEHRRHGGR
jgi:hypothetical protein